MGKAKSGKAEAARCRRHKRQQQGEGVCASCLRERLSHLSLPASLPSVVRGGGGEGEEEYEEGASSCSEVSTAYSSEESSGASSGCASPGEGEPAFHDEMRRAARVSLLMRHERVVGDADAVAAFLAMREQQRRRTTATSFWSKLLHATRGGGGRKQREGCLLAHSKTLQERAAAAKWVLF
ncbi:hypothetical protein ACP70R_026184 [Stipagrostis hirtigluma subsp. patula]